MVALVDARTNKQFCGGTLVASKYVVTAAHCMFDVDERALTLSDFKVRIYGVLWYFLNLSPHTKV